MKQYNKQDVELTEKLYRLLLPYSLKSKEWIPAKQCGKCNNSKLIKKGFEWSAGHRYQALRCENGHRNKGAIVP